MSEDIILAGGTVDEMLQAPRYSPGFLSHHSTEAVAGALPIGRNSPQKPPFGLYAEQLSGTAFTAPLATNRRSWLYRIRPSVNHLRDMRRADGLASHLLTAGVAPAADMTPAQLRWAPITVPDKPTDFVSGLKTMTLAGSCAEQAGMAAHVYAFNRSMGNRVLVNADGELVLLPELGTLRVVTELGVLSASAGELICIPRNVKFRVESDEPQARGYVLENYGQPLTLPERGPIGANGLASPRDFLHPLAAYEDRDGETFEVVLKWQGGIYRTETKHSPLDVVAWHGNHTPYKYDLSRFNTMGSISFDHPDPSIFTVLTSPSELHGTANVDFVIFPDRWLVMEDTFRPPWYHMNVMSEFMGLLYGVYDAKPGGFVPGGMSLHNAGLPHGPDTEAHAAAMAHDLSPQKLAGTMAFMFESRLIQQPTRFAADEAVRDDNYVRCWDGLPRGLHSSS